MKFDQLTDLFGKVPWFDMAALAQMSGDSKGLLRLQMHEWSKAGKVIPLRRGIYALAEKHRHATLHAPLVANVMYTPSYLSGLWALSFYGMIPEKTVTLTCVTTKATQAVENAFGRFEYNRVKMEAFFGFASRDLDGVKVWLADPEKALLDTWYLAAGEWTVARQRQMRFQQTELVDTARLHEYAARFQSPRLLRAVATWELVMADEADGTVEVV